MLQKSLITLLLLVGLQHIAGQNNLWHDHFSYRQCQHIAESENFVAATTDVGLIMYNKLDDKLTTYSRVNGLSDINISAIQALSEDQFIIGYANGNIDILNSGEVINIPDLKNKQIQGNKQINHFHQNGNMAYCSTGFALLAINTEKHEIADTYYLGINSESLAVHESYTLDTHIYAATDRGLLKTQLDNPRITYYEAWEEISGSTDPVHAISYYNDALIMVKYITDTWKVLYGNQSAWTELITLSDFSSLSASGTQLIINQKNKIERYGASYVLSETIELYDFADLTTSIEANDALYSIFEEGCFIADAEHGLVKTSESGDFSFVVNGPYSNRTSSLLATQHDVYSTSGSPERNEPAEYSHYINEEWSFFKASETESGNDWVDIVSSCANKTDDTQVFFSSWGGGLFLHTADETIHYGSNPNGLQAIDGKVKVGGLASDSEGNIWMTNANVESGIVVKSADQWQRFSYESTQFIGGLSQVMVANNNYVWMTVMSSGNPQLLVINPNQTPLDESDDKYRGPISYSSDDRDAGQLKLWDENGDIITHSVLSITEDKNDHIWLGTDKGVLVYYQPWAIFNESVPVVSRIKVPRNDGSNLADYLLEKERVSCITVDGANRKWIGTEGSGIYLVADDGLKTYQTFNMDNSPLPSNNITSIAIAPHSGEVFIGTEHGMVSYKGRATEGDKTFKKIYAYPNPVRNDYNGDITITGLVQDSNVKITTTSGRLVYETQSLGGKAYWDGTNFGGEKVKSGVYLIYTSANDGQESAITKILIVR